METVPFGLSLALFSVVIKVYGIYLVRITLLSSVKASSLTYSRKWALTARLSTHRVCNFFNNKGGLQTTDENSP
jgi:hypothetical protein